jgi:hypothetical protein
MRHECRSTRQVLVGLAWRGRIAIKRRVPRAGFIRQRIRRGSKHTRATGKGIRTLRIRRIRFVRPPARMAVV